MKISSLAQRVLAGRWIAGPEINDAVLLSKKLNAANISAMINYLGEDLGDMALVADSVSTYLELLNAIKKNRLRASISIKPSQIGLATSYALAKMNYSIIARTARSCGVFTWLDMESYDTVDDTIRLYLTELKNGSAGICLQSCLKRSLIDAKRITRKGGAIRLVKGAYKEHKGVAFSTREETTKNYASIMKYLFKESENFIIASHDLDMINIAIRLGKSSGKRLQVAMLNGIRNRYASELALRRVNVSLYIPFGKAWFPYASRRLMEEGHISLIIKSLFERQDVV